MRRRRLLRKMTWGQLCALTTRTREMFPFYTGPFKWPVAQNNSF